MKTFFAFIGLMITSAGAFASSYEKLDGSEEGQGSQQGMRKILFVDDSYMNRRIIPKLLTKSLKKIGLEDYYAVETASDGQKAVNMAEKTSYTLIIMDMQMPNMDGAEATIEIKKSNPDAVVIRFSTLTEDEFLEFVPEEVRGTILDLFSDVLPKPALESDIRNVLKKFLPNNDETDLNT